MNHQTSITDPETASMESIPEFDSADEAGAAAIGHRRRAFIRSLRECADFFEQHPGVKAPRYVTINVFVDTREEVADHARAATWEKIYNDTWFYLRREFGQDLWLDITAPRNAVCCRKVVGTRTIPACPAHEEEIVEWICDDVSLLAK